MTVATHTLQQAVEGFADRVQRVRDAQWTAATPCAEWDVRALVNHVAGELRWIPPLLEGKTIADVGDELSGDLLGEDPMSSWAAAARKATGAALEPGAVDRTVHLSYGDRPAGAYLSEVAGDIVVHTWDLARAVGSDEHLDENSVRRAYEALKPMDAMVRQPKVFGPKLSPPPGSDLQTEFLYFLGRRA